MLALTIKTAEKIKRYKPRTLKLCESCRKVEIPIGRQRYCGSYNIKTGCSYKMRLARYGNKKKYDWRQSELRRFRKRKIESLRKMIRNYGEDEVRAMLQEALKD